MSTINTNVSALLGQRVLRQNNNTLKKSIERLSTGFRINRGADDPAGFIASEKLRSEKTQLSAAIGNAERADQIVNIAEGGLTEVNSLLTELQSLVTQTSSEAGLSTEEKEANQLQIDAILQTIDRIASTTSFQGTKLLNGGYDFQVANVDGDITDYKVNGAKIADGQTVDVTVTVLGSAQHAGLLLSAGSTSIQLGGDPDDRFTFELAGALGNRSFSFASGATLSSVANSITSFKSVTGVSATASGSLLVLKSTQYGSEQFVSIDITAGGGDIAGDGIYSLSATNEAAVGSLVAAFSSATAPIRDEGQDVDAIINGVTARGRGLRASVNTDVLDVSLTFTSSGATTLGSLTALTISGGGARFSLGPTVDTNNQVRLGIQNVAARNLGDRTVGFLSDLASGGSANVVDGSLEDAQKIVSEAIDQISSLRGRLGAFQKNVVGATIRSLSINYENISAAESAIRDTDFAKETAELTRSQVLVNAASSALAIANNLPTNVLQLI